MDGSAFRNLDFSWLPWVLVLAGVGILALMIVAGFGAWWVVSHLQWVS